VLSRVGWGRDLQQVRSWPQAARCPQALVLLAVALLVAPAGRRAWELPALRAVAVTLRQRVQKVQRKNAKAQASTPPPR